KSCGILRHCFMAFLLCPWLCGERLWVHLLVAFLLKGLEERRRCFGCAFSSLSQRSEPQLPRARISFHSSASLVDWALAYLLLLLQHIFPKYQLLRQEE